MSNYWYDAAGERTVKTSGESQEMYVNSVFSGGDTQTANFTAYVNPYLVVSKGGQYTKHIYIGSQRSVSKLGDLDSYGQDPRRIEYAGAGVDGAKVDYKAKYQKSRQAIKDNYAAFEVPYYGTDNDDYVNGGGFCCDDTPRLKSFNPSQNDNPELYQYYYHSDHLGSSSLITNLDGETVQHIEYVPFGEVFIEERNNVWNTPYLFNAKELDEETGLYYYGARYYDPRISLWLSTDPLQEKYPNISTYAYVENNPVKYIDLDGKEKLIYYLIPTLDSYHASMYPDDGAIHIFTHSSNRILGLEGFMGINKARVWGGSDLAFVLEHDSEIWKNRTKGEKLTIVIHGCNVANDKDGISLAEKISASSEFKDHTIIAPDKKFIIGDIDGRFEYIGVYGDKIVNGETAVNYEDKGNWIVFENGKKVKTIPGDQMPTSKKKDIETKTIVNNFNYQSSLLPVTNNTNIINDEN